MTTGAASVRVLLVRHAESLLNALGRVQGWTDSPLTDDGRVAAVSLGSRLRDEGARLVAVRSADGMRHRETAALAALSAGSDLAPETDPRLREIAFGAFEAAAHDELWATLAAASDEEVAPLDLLARLPDRSRERGFPAESASGVLDRMLHALDDAWRSASRAGGGDVLVVSSGIGIMLVLRHLGADPGVLRGGIRNGALNVLSRSAGGWVVQSADDLAVGATTDASRGVAG